MVSGLVVKSKNEFNIQVKNLKPVEEFEKLDLLKKYGFNVGQFTFGKNIHVILKHIKKGEKQIYLAEEIIDEESILN